MRASDRPAGNAFLRLYRGQTNYDFINRWKIWFLCSGTVIVIGLAALFIGGLNFSIDFRGGSLWQTPTAIRTAPSCSKIGATHDVSVATVRSDLGKLSPLLAQATIVQLTNQQTGQRSIQVEASSSVTGNTQLVKQVTSEMASIGKVPVDCVTAELIGPSWGSSITNKAIEAVVVFLVLIAIAISLYFEAKMAVGALVALVHDILVTVGIYALSGFQVSPDTVIAFLTVMGYSLYDTIVVFDKVKENTRGLASTNRYTYTDVVNLSMNQVMARSVNTSFVAIMPVFCILVIGSWILGASALNDFGLALFIGLMSGAYSSIFIASPILALLKEREPRYVEIRRRIAAYPQSRQRLTTAMVADGSLLTARSGPGTSDLPTGISGRSVGTSSGGRRGSSRNGAPALGGADELALPQAAPAASSRARAPGNGGWSGNGGESGHGSFAESSDEDAAEPFLASAGAAATADDLGAGMAGAVAADHGGSDEAAGDHDGHGDEASPPAAAGRTRGGKVPPRPAGPRPRKKPAPRRR